MLENAADPDEEEQFTVKEWLEIHSLGCFPLPAALSPSPPPSFPAPWGSCTPSCPAPFTSSLLSRPLFSTLPAFSFLSFRLL